MPDIKSFLNALIAKGIACDAGAAACAVAGRDASQLESIPLAVVRPASTEQIAETVKFCNRYNLPVTVAGGYTGLSGGVLGYKAVRIDTRQLNRFAIKGDRVVCAPGASVPEIMRATAAAGFVFPFQPASASRKEDSYDYLGNPVGPVTVGGSIGANASGLVGCKLGAALDWVRGLTVVLPDGTVREETAGFERYAGTEGRYGIIAQAEIGLLPVPAGIETHLVCGNDLDSFVAAAEAIGASGALPLLAETIVMGGAPPDLHSLACRLFPDPETFWTAFGHVFQPYHWLVLLQGTPDEVEACRTALTTTGHTITISRLTDLQFSQFKQIRSAASDEIGTGVSNPAPYTGPDSPVKRAALFLAEAIAEFGKRGIKPKGEHNFGLLWVFLTDDAGRAAYRSQVSKREAFDDGSLSLHEACGGRLETFFEKYLAPRVTENMIATRTAVNFPGNEDILIRAEQFPGTIELLDTLMKKYGACPVPLYYCHINFRRMPGWILLHNRLLIDVMEFGKGSS